MTPSSSILDGSFRYVSSVSTSVANTWRRFGWRPTNDEERNARRRRAAEATAERLPEAETGGSDRRLKAVG